MTDTLSLSGRSILRAFPAGILSVYLDNHIDLTELLHKIEPLAVFANTQTNLIVTVGKELVADLLLDQETVGITYHAFGTESTTPVVGNTVLGTEAGRKLWTAKTRATNVLTFSVFYLASECTFYIRECGVFGGSTASATTDSGKLFSHYLQPYDNSAGNVDLTFEYELTIG